MFVGEYEIKEGLKYTKTHEWAKVVDGTMTVGVTDFASKEMGDVAFVELPEPGKAVVKDEVLCEIESVKAVSEVESPADGTIEEVNQGLEDLPENINEDPYGAWIAKIKIKDEPSDLMSPEEYKDYIEGLEKD